MESENIININGYPYSFEAGETILDVANRNNIYIPTLCHLKDTTPTGACRVCLVEVEGGRGLPAACAMPAGKNMKVLTESPKVINARRQVIAFLMASGNHNCAARGDSNMDYTDFQLGVRNYDASTDICPSYGSCELQKLAYKYQVAELLARLNLTEFKPHYPLEDANPFIIRDFSRCILCGRCVKACNEIQVNKAIAFGYRGAEAKIVATGDNSLVESDCVFCGQCMQVCPVAALTLKEQRYNERFWELDRTKTTCTFCGTGCSIDVYTNKKKEIVKVEGTENGIVNQGSLCIKGRFGNDFVQSEERLTQPMLKDGDSFKPITWDDALGRISKKLGEIKSASGPDSIAGFASARCTNEENYIMQKFFRAALGTNNIDHCARLCHSSTIAGLTDAFGSGAMTNSIKEIPQSDCILLTGSNTTENHPVIGSKIKRAVNRDGTKLIVVEPREINMTRSADIFLQPKPGTDSAWINGFLNVIISEDLYDKEYVTSRTEGFEEMKKAVAQYTPDKVEEITGIPKDKLVEAARLYAQAGTGAIYYAMGITQHTTGTDNVKSLANLAMLCGNVGIEGGGVNPLMGQNNIQGACDCGCLPNVYPDYQDVTDESVAGNFAKAWGAQLSKKAGLTVTEIPKAIEDGRVKALYVMGENPMVSDADISNMEKALKGVDFLVVQDIFMTETAKFADIVLPAASFAEKEGTFTNTERRVQRVRKVVDSPGDAREDWKIFVELSKRMGYQMDVESAKDIFEEISKVSSSYAGISYGRIDKEGGLQWPCPGEAHPGTPVLHKDQFIRGKGRFHGIEYSPPAESPDDQYPLILTTGTVLEHHHTGTMTRHSEGLNKLYPAAVVEINPADAEKLSVADTEKVTVTSRRGSISLSARITDRSPEGVVFIPSHFAEAAVNRLTNPVVDPVSHIPEYKVCAVRIGK